LKGIARGLIEVPFGNSPEETEEYHGNRSTTDQIFCIRQILEKRWEYIEKVHHLFVDFKIQLEGKYCTVFS
jgi:hypothetical protein